MLKPGQYEVVAYQRRPGDSPYWDWLSALDAKTRVRIDGRVRRMTQGQFGDYKRIDSNLYELRLFFGPGYRVHFGDYKGRMILLWAGGDKSTQGGDIRMARQYWKNYLENYP